MTMTRSMTAVGKWSFETCVRLVSIVAYAARLTWSLPLKKVPDSPIVRSQDTITLTGKCLALEFIVVANVGRASETKRVSGIQ